MLEANFFMSLWSGRLGAVIANWQIQKIQAQIDDTVGIMHENM